MIEDWTIDDLLSWANGLGVCTFKKRKCEWKHVDLWDQEIVCEKGRVKIEMHFGRFSESVPDDGGKRCVHFGYTDERDGGYSGGGCAYADLDKLAARIEKRAVELGLAEAQMSIFSLL